MATKNSRRFARRDDAIASHPNSPDPYRTTGGSGRVADHYVYDILNVHKITADIINVTQLSAITADVGILTAGRLENAGGTVGILLSGTLPGAWTDYIDFTATGNEPFLKHTALTLEADGDADFGGVVSASSFTAAEINLPDAGKIVFGTDNTLNTISSTSAAMSLLAGNAVTTGVISLEGSIAADGVAKFKVNPTVTGGASFAFELPTDTSRVSIISQSTDTSPALAAGTLFMVIHEASAGDDANIAIIANATGHSRIHFGDATDEDVGYISYDHNLDAIEFGHLAMKRVTVARSVTIHEDGNNPGLVIDHGGANLYASIQGPANRDFRFLLRDNDDGDSFEWRNAAGTLLASLDRTGIFDVKAGILTATKTTVFATAGAAGLYIQNHNSTAKRLYFGQYGGSTTEMRILPYDGGFLFSKEMAYDFTNARWRIESRVYFPDSIVTGNGTAGAPAYSFSGDTNTGMYWVSADKLGWATAGVSRMSLNATGLDVVAEARCGSLRIDQNAATIGAQPIFTHSFTLSLNGTTRTVYVT